MKIDGKAAAACRLAADRAVAELKRIRCVALDREMHGAAPAGTFKLFGHGETPKPAWKNVGATLGSAIRLNGKGVEYRRQPMKHALLGAASALFLMTGGAFAAPADQPGHESPKPGTSSKTVSAVKDATPDWLARRPLK